MNNLKTARRSLMGNLLLRTLIVEEWRAQSSRGRYESAMWRAAGLEEPDVKGAVGTSRNGATNEVAEPEADVDNTTAGGFFQYLGRDPNGPRPTVVPPMHTPAPAPEAELEATGTE